MRTSAKATLALIKKMAEWWPEEKAWLKNWTSWAARYARWCARIWIRVAPRHRRQPRQIGGARALDAQALTVQGRSARRLQQAQHALLLALRNQAWGGVGGGHHVQRGGLQAHRVENRVGNRHGLSRVTLSHIRCVAHALRGTMAVSFDLQEPGPPDAWHAIPAVGSPDTEPLSHRRTLFTDLAPPREFRLDAHQW